VRLLVPMDPWRYYEMVRIVDEPYRGRCLDVSSPKLLPSLLNRQGRGEWTCVDLFQDEISAWRTIDPNLRVEVQDATKLDYPDESFDTIVCISVLEHISDGGDALALSEFWRVLRPDGILHLTTDVAENGRESHLRKALYGGASPAADDKGVFFKRDYDIADLDALIHQRPWKVDVREFAMQRHSAIEKWFYALSPFSFIVGPLLGFVCSRNFKTSISADLVSGPDHGVIYLRLIKPLAGPVDGGVHGSGLSTRATR
jgi:SAM-dependent methyltransferase